MVDFRQFFLLEFSIVIMLLLLKEDNIEKRDYHHTKIFETNNNYHQERVAEQRKVNFIEFSIL